MAVFTTQDLTVTLESDISLGTANPLKIRFEKTDGTTGEVTAVAGGTGNQSATGQLTPSILDQTGDWTFIIEAVISSKTYFSSEFNLFVKEVITDPTP